MKSLDFSRYVAGSCVAAAMLAGCGGSQPPIGAPGAMPQTSAIATHADRGTSWMLPGTSAGDLVYATSVAFGNVYVYTYPKGGLVGTLTGFIQPTGACSDRNGDVFIVASNGSFQTSTIYEYAHGGTTPIATLSDPAAGYGCAIDPSTGNLAVANVSDYSNPYNQNYGDIAIFQGAQGSPAIYHSAIYSEFHYCGYDNQGNLYVSAFDASNKENQLVRLASGSSAIATISLNRDIESGERMWPSVQWDGQHMTVSSGIGAPHVHEAVSIYRLKISGDAARVVGTTVLGSDRVAHGGQSWIHKKSIIGIFYRNGALVADWSYPNGGQPRYSIAKVRYDELSGVTVSTAQH